ncbi:uncharacterized protein LOC110441329 [Mizuhopecten yessoensis]|uniref:uncharacterized protein LOC110441329 n=1 Tax=Mizuhopecten yessoensis TaxID=6573 RepID=UPI000B45DF43|nr:uncharacterized protein LOC110441329 [Mizuhopecten yessoensis]
MEEVASIHSVVDSTDDEKTVDYITLALEVEIAKNLVIYTCHQYIGSNWTKTEIEQKVGRSTVEVDVYDFTTETIFFTFRYMCEDVIVPSGGFEYKNDYCPQQRITFPEGAVERNMKITINTMSIEGECKKKRLKEEMGSDTSISSLSDIVYVHHSQPFKKKVKLRLKLDPLFNDSQSSETFLFHCDDNGCLRILEDVKMRRVLEDDVEGDKHIYEVEVDTFSGKAAVTITPWSNEERNARFSEIKVEKDDVFVSTIFNITIQEIEQKVDGDSTTTADATPSTDEVKAVRDVIFKHNSRKMVEVASIHSVIDSTDDEKTVDCIMLALEQEITKNLVIYTCHQYNGSEWTKTEIEQKLRKASDERFVCKKTTRNNLHFRFFF